MRKGGGKEGRKKGGKKEGKKDINCPLFYGLINIILIFSQPQGLCVPLGEVR